MPNFLQILIPVLAFAFSCFALVVFLIICQRFANWLLNPKGHDMDSNEAISELVKGVALVLFGLYVLREVLR